MAETLFLAVRQVLTVTAATTATAELVRLGRNPGDARIATYALAAGGVLTFGPFSDLTRWSVARLVGDGEPTFTIAEPAFVPVGVFETALADLDHATANAAFAYATPEAGWLRWNPVAQAWQNVAGAAGAPVSIHAPTVASLAASPGFVSGSTAGLDGASAGFAGQFWLNEPTEFSFAWLLDGEAISGATGAEYVIQAGDVGGELACRVTASNARGSATVTTPAVSVV